MKGKMICVEMLTMSLFVMTAYARVPPLMNYQGKLTDEYGVPVPDGSYSIWFRIYDDSTGGNVLWAEEQSSVQVSGGLFSVLLGCIFPISDTIFTGPTRWLEIQVSSDPEMMPRKPIVSVGYAFFDGDWVADGSDIYRVDGDVGVGGKPPMDAKFYVETDTVGWKYAIYAEGRKGIKGVNTGLAGTGVSGEGGHAGVAGYGGYIGVLGQGFYGGCFEGHGHFSGNVGIGTMTPEAKLHLTNDSWDDPNTTIRLHDVGVEFAKTVNLTAIAADMYGYFSGLKVDNNIWGTRNLFITDQVYAGMDGIGLTTTFNKLTVKGSAAIGTTYCSYTAPPSGLIVEGGVGIGTLSPTATLDVNGSTGYNQVRMRTSYTPTGTSDTNGNVGDIAWDANYIYIKTSAGWKRAALSAF